MDQPGKTITLIHLLAHLPPGVYVLKLPPASALVLDAPCDEAPRVSSCVLARATERIWGPWPIDVLFHAVERPFQGR